MGVGVAGGPRTFELLDTYLSHPRFVTRFRPDFYCLLKTPIHVIDPTAILNMLG
jgi:hypothetical protein